MTPATNPKKPFEIDERVHVHVEYPTLGLDTFDGDGVVERTSADYSLVLLDEATRWLGRKTPRLVCLNEWMERLP